MTQEPSEQVTAPKSAPAFLKNHIAKLSGVIEEGGFGVVYRGELDNLFALIAERGVWGEFELLSLLVPGLPIEKSDTQAGRFLRDPEMRRRIYEAAAQRWKEYQNLKESDPNLAQVTFRNLLECIDASQTSRSVAIKVLRPPVMADASKDQEQAMIEFCEKQFVRENRLLSSLRHRNIVRHIGLVVDPGLGYCMILEYLNGITLDDYLRKFGAMPPEAAISYIAEVAEAIQYCHDGAPDRQSVLHRDLKPGNIMLCHDGAFSLKAARPVIIDFGIGKFATKEQTQLTIAGMRMGTPRYMAPEQWEADPEKIIAAVDVYLLSQVLFEMLTGEPAYSRDDDLVSLQKMVTNTRLPHPKGLRDFEHLKNVSRALEDLVEIGRRKAPARRWTIHEFIFQARSIVKNEYYLQSPEPRRSLTELRIEKKIHDYRSEQIDTSIHFVMIEEGLKEARRLLKCRDYETANRRLAELANEVLALPKRYNALKQDTLRLLTVSALLQYRAGSFMEVGGILDTAKPFLEIPAEGIAVARARYAGVMRRFETHRPLVQALRMIRETFVDGIRAGVLALFESERKGGLDADRVRDLLGQAESARAMLGNIDARKVGPHAHEKTAKHLVELVEILRGFAEKSSTAGEGL